MRYFRSAVDTYNVICSTLDAAYGYPNHETKTYRALPLASDLPQDASGRVYLAVSVEYCDYILSSEMLASLKASGSVDEIEREEYETVAPPP